ncbi:histidine phosphatase family protein [Lacticaseibacillus suihuaensis]
MRHGETLFNVENRIQGWCDSPLTPRGIAQGQAAATWFARHRITFDAAFCSTAERASDTLELVTDQPYRRVKGLREWGFGRFEGQPESLNPAIPYNDFFVPYGGEAQQAVEKRVVQTIGSLMAATPGQSVLMVSHAGAIRNFLARHADAAVLQAQLPNCGIVQFTYAAGAFTLVRIVDPAQDA